MDSLENLNKRIRQIEERNRRVESNKAWETSWTRKIILVTFTYLSLGFYIQVIGIEKPWLNAIIPSLAFLLSTLTLPFFKSLWSKFIRK